MEVLIDVPLSNKHLALKAKMAPFAGYNMPLQYSSIKEEVMAVRNNCGVFDVSHMGEFLIEGPDVNKFVDYIISNNFLNSPVGKAVYSPLCNLEGGVVDDLIAYKISNNKTLLCVNASNIYKDFNWISQFKNKFNCTMTDQSSKYCLLALQGPKSSEVLKQCIPSFNAKIEYYSIQNVVHQNEEIIIARTGYTGEDGFEIFCSSNMAANLWDLFLELKVTPCGLAARDVLRLEVCYPLYGHELNDHLSPIESGLGWTFKKEKIDFVGKLAVLKKQKDYRLVKLKISQGIPRQGYQILNSNQQIIGEITSGTLSVTINQGICLALVKTSLYPNDEKFYIRIREKIFPASLETKAFVSGGHK